VRSGLPDGIFQTKILIWVKFGGPWPAIDDVGLFYGHLIYFMPIWYILWPFGIFCGNLVIFTRVCKLYQKIWQPCVRNGCCVTEIDRNRKEGNIADV
jgi:hypothetical protein